MNIDGGTMAGIFLGLAIFLGGIVMYQALRFSQRLDSHEKVLTSLIGHANAVSNYICATDAEDNGEVVQ